MRDLQKYAMQALQMCCNENIPYGKILSFSADRQSVKRLGVCKGKPEDGFHIRINRMLLDETLISDEHLVNTLIHEILHTCPGCQNHGQIWKNYAAVINRAYGMNIKRLASYEDLGITKEHAALTGKFRWRISCSNPDCDMQMFFARAGKRVKYAKYCRCGRCKSPVVLEKITV